jgi:hypothetical protein
VEVKNIKLYTVWKNNCRGIEEKCLLTDEGHYIGQDTGIFYSNDEHYHNDQITAKIVKIEDENNTGMLHLADDSEFEEDYRLRKTNFIGCIATFEEAHYYGDIKVYRCLELGEYFSQNELEILN